VTLERKEEEFVKERRRRAERLLCTVKVVDVEFVCDENRHIPPPRKKNLRGNYLKKMKKKKIYI
jgi:hypothetical protein